MDEMAVLGFKVPQPADVKAARRGGYKTPTFDVSAQQTRHLRTLYK